MFITFQNLLTTTVLDDICNYNNNYNKNLNNKKYDYININTSNIAMTSIFHS